MPINTTPEIITYIFNTINPAWELSEIRLEPGIEQRHDRWQLMLKCSEQNEIPHQFVLPKRGPEKEDLTIKVFVTGRVSPCVHCHGEHRSNQCPNPPPPPRPEPRPQTADSQPRDTGVPQQVADWDKIPNLQQDKFKTLIQETSKNYTIPAFKTIQNILRSNKSASMILKDCEIEKALEENPVVSNKNANAFTSHSSMHLKEKRKHVLDSDEFKEKRAAGEIFVRLFGSLELHSDDLEVLNDFVYGNSSYDRTVQWLCQYAQFLEMGTKPNTGEITVFETLFNKK